MAEITLNKDNFKSEILDSPLPALIDFWAPWCGPCRMLAPVVAEIADEYEGRIKVGKVNVDEEPALANAFGVNAIPALFLVRDGKIAAVSEGYRPKEQIVALLGDI